MCQLFVLNITGGGGYLCVLKFCTICLEHNRGGGGISVCQTSVLFVLNITGGGASLCVKLLYYLS